MKCPYCEQKTMVKETFMDLNGRNAPASVSRLVKSHGFEAQSVARRRRCLNPPCLLRYDSIEMSVEDLTTLLEDVAAQAMATAREAS
jgi:transcriptional regulator NrdR family protein